MINKYSLSIFFSLLYTTYSLLFSQVVYEPVNKEIYNYLDRLSQKGIIDFDDLIRPVSRKYIAEKLIEANDDINKLTSLEREELEFYKKEYGRELSFLNTHYSLLDTSATSIQDEQGSSTISPSGSKWFSNDKYGRPRLFSYEDNLFSVNLSPILGYEIGKREGEKISHSWSGVGFYGYLTNHIGFSFDYRDNSETGLSRSDIHQISPKPGVVVSRSKKNSIEYSEVHTTVAVDWDWGEFSIGKDYMQWGYGKSGQLVLSQKAPSFPFMRLDIYPVKWLRFNYFHGWLNSDVIDSSAIYPTYRDGVYRDQYRNKFLASHTLTIKPFNGFDISLGESIVYSDKLEISYLMPFMFFRLADHYLSQNNNDAGSNSQFFFNISSKNHLPNTHLFATLLIDEVTMSDIFDHEKQRTQLGFTLGGSVVDLPINNLTLSLEYTKIYPFVYRHYIPTQTYENASYTMGHWIGHNSDIIFSSLNYRIIRGLQATVWGNYVRKGEDGHIDDQYKVPQSPFLFGLHNNTTNYGIEVKYEYMHDLFIRTKYQHNKYSEQQKSLDFIDTSESEFTFAVYYGL